MGDKTPKGPRQIDWSQIEFKYRTDQHAKIDAFAKELGIDKYVLRDFIRSKIKPGITPAAKVLETGTYVSALNKIAAFEGGIKASSKAAEAAKTTTNGVG